MGVRRLFLNFHYGNRGLFFMLDVIIAVFIVIFILAISVFYIDRAEDIPISKIQASRIGSDIFAVLDYSGVLREFDIDRIRSEIDSMTPLGYNIEYKIDCSSRIYDSRTNLSGNYVFAGERIFIDKDFNNCIVRHWIWLD